MDFCFIIAFYCPMSTFNMAPTPKQHSKCFDYNFVWCNVFSVIRFPVSINFAKEDNISATHFLFYSSIAFYMSPLNIPLIPQLKSQFSLQLLSFLKVFATRIKNDTNYEACKMFPIKSKTEKQQQ